MNRINFIRSLFNIAALSSLLLICAPGNVAAQSETEELRKEVEQLRKMLEVMEERLQAMEAEQSDKTTDESVEETVAKAPEVDEEAEKKKGLADYMDAYGSLRVRTGVDSSGLVEIDDNVSRIGINGDLPFADERYGAFAGFEVGIRMVSSPNQIQFNADPGGALGQEDDTITSRLGFAGFRTPVGSFSWGKQNSTYYDLAGWTTDQSFVFGGEASGAYNNGTDGGPSGTGRAGTAAQYRVGFGPMRAGFQAQHRDQPDNPNSRNWGDTLGGSLVYQGESGLSAGIAYQEVRDGVEDPEPGLPKIGDTSTIFGLRYQTEKYYLGGVYSVTEQHETDDLGNFFDGNGVELYGNYLVGKSIKVEGGYVYLKPDSGQAGDYRLNYGYAGLGYLFGGERKGAVWLEYRLDDSQANDGSKLRNNLFAGGVTFDF
jgi:hypothetical protein